MSLGSDNIEDVPDLLEQMRASGYPEQVRNDTIRALDGAYHPQTIASIRVCERVSTDGLVMERSGVGVEICSVDGRTYVRVTVVPSPYAYCHRVVANTQVREEDLAERVGLACDLAWQLIRLREGGWVLDGFTPMRGVLVRAPQVGEEWVTVRHSAKRPEDVRVPGYVGVSHGYRGARAARRVARVLARLTALSDTPPRLDSAVRDALAAHGEDVREVALLSADEALRGRIVGADSQQSAAEALLVIDEARRRGEGHPGLAVNA